LLAFSQFKSSVKGDQASKVIGFRYIVNNIKAGENFQAKALANPKF